MLGGLVQIGRQATFEQLPALVAKHAAHAGFDQSRIYVVDLRAEVLRELTGRGPDAGAGGEELRVDGTLAGQAFRDIRVLPAPLAPGEDRRRYWVPVLDGTERLGLLRVAVSEMDRETEAAARQLAALVGLLLVSKRAVSDSHYRLIRSQPMTVAAEMQWHLMPPPSYANDRVVIGAAMEPAYEVGGDAFDYALTQDTVHLGLFDAMGHDAAAGLCANLAVAACRAYRRQGADLVATGREIERSLIEQFGFTRYATAILADFDSQTGQLTWINHGHHPPIIIRGGRWIPMLSCEPAHPLGMDLGLVATVCREQLEPGDRLVLYTDGVTEGRDAAGREFGLARIVDFVVRHQADGLPVQETLRRLMRLLMDHHGGQLHDDATVLFLEWTGPEHSAYPDPTIAAGPRG